MINLPQWLQRVLDESVCPACKIKADKTGVFAVGIREEVHAKTKRTFLSFFFLYVCNKCKKMSTFSGLPTSFEDFIGDMMEIASSPTPTTADFQNLEEIHEAAEESQQGITDKEVKDLKKSLKSAKYFEDFLTDIGIDKNEIDKKDDHDKEDK